MAFSYINASKIEFEKDPEGFPVCYCQALSPLGKLGRSKPPHSQGAEGGPLLGSSTSVLADQREKKHLISHYICCV